MASEAPCEVDRLDSALQEIAQSNHHVNCQPGEYWIEKLAAHGFNWLQIDTDRVRKMASDDGAWHLARSGLVFARRL
jgi:hypothetical protein